MTQCVAVCDSVTVCGNIVLGLSLPDNTTHFPISPGQLHGLFDPFPFCTNPSLLCTQPSGVSCTLSLALAQPSSSLNAHPNSTRAFTQRSPSPVPVPSLSPLLNPHAHAYTHTHAHAHAHPCLDLNLGPKLTASDYQHRHSKLKHLRIITSTNTATYST